MSEADCGSSLYEIMWKVKSMNKNALIFIVLWFAVALLMLKVYVFDASENSRQQARQQEIVQSVQPERETVNQAEVEEAVFDVIDKKLASISGNIPLIINPVSDYDDLSKEDIYSLRKRYVAQSLFAYDGYEPSDEVFGQIESYKPWYGLTYSGCIASAIGTEKVFAGPSEESRFVNNPNMLVGVANGSKRAPLEHPACFDKDFWAMPVSMSYDSDTKTVTAVYDFRYKGYYSLNGINARDLGYRYVYAEKSDNFIFRNEPNITGDVFEFVDFIHLGGSCQYKDGCNNGSPRQDYLNFTFNDYPAELKLKLYRNRPKSFKQAADINYRIIFR